MQAMGWSQWGGAAGKLSLGGGTCSERRGLVGAGLAEEGGAW